MRVWAGVGQYLVSVGPANKVWRGTILTLNLDDLALLPVLVGRLAFDDQ